MRIPSCDMVEKALRIVVGKNATTCWPAVACFAEFLHLKMGRREVRPYTVP